MIRFIMRTARKTELGFVHIPIILVAIVVFSGVLTVISPQALREKVNGVINAAKEQKLPEETPTPLRAGGPQGPEATPSLTPTPTLTPTPSPTPTYSPTPKPTSPPAVSGPPSSGYSRITVATERGSFLIDVVSIDISAGVRMITDTANDSDCGDNCPTLSLADYVARNGGFAGMNGTYFCPVDYADCAAKKNSFDFPVYNSRLGKWINGGNLFWNNRSIVYSTGGALNFQRNANSFGGGLSAGIVNHPGLLDGGGVIADQFGLSDKQASKRLNRGLG